MDISQLEVIVRLLLAVAMGGLIGLEREHHGRPAGFRTHILVCVGSALVMLTSIYGFAGTADTLELRYDPGRLAAQVVSGIGFLGAGTILREGATVRGLTTAASLWVIAGIGLAIGIGYYLGAVATTILVVMTLVLLNKVEQRFLGAKARQITVRIFDRPGSLAEVTRILAGHKVDIKKADIQTDGTEYVTLEFVVEVPPGQKEARFINEIAALESVIRVKYQDY